MSRGGAPLRLNLATLQGECLRPCNSCRPHQGLSQHLTSLSSAGSSAGELFKADGEVVGCRPLPVHAIRTEYADSGVSSD